MLSRLPAQPLQLTPSRSTKRLKEPPKQYLIEMPARAYKHLHKRLHEVIVSYRQPTGIIIASKPLEPFLRMALLSDSQLLYIDQQMQRTGPNCGLVGDRYTFLILSWVVENELDLIGMGYRAAFDELHKECIVLALQQLQNRITRLPEPLASFITPPLPIADGQFHTSWLKYFSALIRPFLPAV